MSIAAHRYAEYALRLGGIVGLVCIAATVGISCDNVPFLSTSGKQQTDRNTGAIKVLPLGDSITQGFTGQQSYRYPLWKKIVDAGWNVDFVGNQTKAKDDRSSWPDYKEKKFDRNHEGHSSWKTDSMSQNVTKWTGAYQYDAVLLHIGSNDIRENRGDIRHTADSVAAIVVSLNRANPNAVVFIAKIVPAKNPVRAGRIAQLNEQVESRMTQLRKDGIPIVIVDQFSGFDPENDLLDTVHPNANGEEIMAAKWFDALKQNYGLITAARIKRIDANLSN